MGLLPKYVNYQDLLKDLEDNKVPCSTYDDAVAIVQAQEKVETVFRGTFEQVKWERDIAIDQLKSYGIELGEKADLAEVKHGRWLISCDGYYPYCSECREEPENGKMTKYCGNCGAKMDNSILRKCDKA